MRIGSLRRRNTRTPSKYTLKQFLLIRAMLSCTVTGLPHTLRSIRACRASSARGCGSESVMTLRASCRFGRACQDAVKASELDPSYTKAFSRLASAQQALQLYGKSAQSWKRALETIPSGDTNEVSAKLRIDYGKNLAEAQRLHTRLEQGSVPIPGHPDKRQIVAIGRKYPWDRAQEMIPRLMAQGITKSSAYALVGSWQNLSPAIEILALARTQGSDTGIGGTGAVLLLSNAILADSRCLFLSFKDILPNLQFQMRMELILARTPKDLLDVDAFNAGMRALHAEGGHDISRKAFSLAVRRHH
ncbi:hypothetical protein PENSPDRAFT_331808 [Peniophora sp. CONT]|nr:hypothetical protein PENSPDRAFT_331808 [Peniophora sp. CONT]